MCWQAREHPGNWPVFLGEFWEPQNTGLRRSPPGGKDWGVCEKPVSVAGCLLQGMLWVGVRQCPLSGEDASQGQALAALLPSC